MVDDAFIDFLRTTGRLGHVFKALSGFLDVVEGYVAEFIVLTRLSLAGFRPVDVRPRKWFDFVMDFCGYRYFIEVKKGVDDARVRSSLYRKVSSFARYLLSRMVMPRLWGYCNRYVVAVPENDYIYIYDITDALIEAMNGRDYVKPLNYALSEPSAII